MSAPFTITKLKNNCVWTTTPIDKDAAICALTLVGAPTNSHTLEIAWVGPKIIIKEKGFIAISGAELPLYINEIEQKTNESVKDEKDDQITLYPIKKGFRAYLAFGQKKCKGPFYELPKIIPLKAFLGPEHQLLPPVIKKTLIHQTFKVTKNTNRMGMQLTPRIKSDLPEIITSPVLPGTVQCTPSGRLIVLLADCQVTGGYPRILQLTKESIQKIAQRAPSSEIKFQIIEY